MRLISFAVSVVVFLYVTPVRAEDSLASDRPVQVQLTPCLDKAVPEALQPQPSAPIHQRWYFWVAVAGTVAAAVTVGLVAANSHPAETLTSEQICQGPCTGCIGLSC